MRETRNQSPTEATLEPVVSKLERFVLYETTSHFYLTASDKRETQYRVLKIDRRVVNPVSLADICQEDPVVYTPIDMIEMLDMINEGNRTVGGLRMTAKGYGIVGFAKFLDCYYLNFITQRRLVGAIGGNLIYAIKSTEMFAVKPADAASGTLSSSAAHGSDSNAFVSTLAKVNRRLNPTPRETAEAKYLGLFQFIDLTKDFFYSYTYDLTNSLQHNMTAATSKTFPPPPFKDMYAWNFHQTRELEAQVGHLNSSFWVVPIVHGAFLQRKCDLSGRMLSITVIARRSRHFAGTRYLKRGVSDTGNVANDVEVEQIAHAEAIKEGVFSSFVQMRGSIPTFWTQESAISIPKPPIVNSRVDPMYSATQAHFADLLERYGSPVLVLDLVKQTERREREVIVGREYRRAVEHVNSTMPPEHHIRYCALDFSHLSKNPNMNVLKALEEVAAWTVGQVGFFCSAPRRDLKHLPTDQGSSNCPSEPRTLKRPRSFPQRTMRKVLDTPEAQGSLDEASVPREGGRHSENGALNVALENATQKALSGDVAGLVPPPWGQGLAVMPMEQQGVLRTNCIDCLDRTNVGQFSIGVHALAKQLYVMGVSNQVSLDSGSQIVLVLMDLYSELGDNIALQYGGSEAHKKVSSSSGPGKQVGSMNKHRELLTSIRRYYSNAFTDRAKQDAINLFLGYFVPDSTRTPLWELDTDYYLHNFHVQNAGLQSMREYKKDQYFLDQDEEPTADSSEPGKGTSSAATTLSGMIDQDRIAETQLKRRRVRRMCSRQRAATSQWWRDSLQRYAQRRMWMHLGPPKQGQLPERFVRIHEPEQLTVFDKWFSHEFAVPVPGVPGRQGSAQAGRPPSGVSPSTAEEKRSRSVMQKPAKEAPGGDKSVTIGRYVREISVKARSMLGRQPRGALGSSRRPMSSDRIDREPDTRQDQMWSARNVAYIGSPIAKEDADKELTSYAAFSDELVLLVDPAQETDLDSYLADFTLSTDTAKGVLALQKLAEEHHCGANLTVEPYEGLRKDVSARRVAAAVARHVQQLGWATQRDLDLEEDWQLTQDHLQHTGINADGVINQIRRRLDHEEQEHAHLEKILGSESLGSRSSTLTTEESMDLYCSFFSKDCAMETKSSKEPAPSRGKYSSVSSARWPVSEASPDGGHRDDCPNFVSLEEDLFSSKENQYMLFNEAGKNNASRILFGK
ncbi:unnamed protein product [Laminaria digitata]